MQERGVKLAAVHKAARQRNIELASVGWTRVRSA